MSDTRTDTYRTAIWTVTLDPSRSQANAIANACMVVADDELAGLRVQIGRQALTIRRHQAEWDRLRALIAERAAQVERLLAEVERLSGLLHLTLDERNDRDAEVERLAKVAADALERETSEMRRREDVIEEFRKRDESQDTIREQLTATIADRDASITHLTARLAGEP